MKDRAVVSVYVPEQEPITLQLSENSARFGFAVKRFKLQLISAHKYTSQLKCQGFVQALMDVPDDRLLLIVDADTYCLKPVHFEEEIIQEVRTGKIAIVPDVADRHENKPGRPWFLAKEKRLRYVNSGVILATNKALPLFERFLALAKDPQYLDGPFNDQNIINFALGEFFPKSLILLDKRFNGMARYLNDQTVIGHFAGGAGRIHQRQTRHRDECDKIIGAIGNAFAVS